MPKHFASISEANAALIFEALGCVPCQTFAPHFQTEFTDKRKFTGTYLPDFKHVCPITGKITFFETKFAELNTKGSHETSENKLRSQYRHRFGNDAGLKYHQVSKALWNSKWRNDCLLHAFNHSLIKHLLIQKTLGRENYIVVFGNDLPQKIADDYTKKGLFFLHISEVAAFLTSTTYQSDRTV